MSIRVEILAYIEERRLRRESDKVADSFEAASVRAGKSIEDNVGGGSERAALRAERALNRVNDAQERANRLRAQYDSAGGGRGVDNERAARIAEHLADAERTVAKATRDRGLAQRAAALESRAAGDALDVINRKSKDAATSIGQLGKTSFSVGRGGLVIGLAALGPLLIDTAKVAATATQSIYLLPAALTAAGTAFGTLKLATMGFSDALEDIGDPEKFAEGLAKLSPAAQQAALSIRAILPELKGLQAATQDSFFAGLGTEFENLSSVYLPEVQKLTTGVADSFNAMIKNIGAQFLTPDMQANFGVIGTNIGQMFENLVPAATSLSQAFVDITASGSSFLPGLATDISDAAREFANFISEARESGQLAEWIREGIDAVKLLGTAIWDIGEFIYDVFGSDGKKNIEDFTDTLQGLESVLNALSGDFGSFNDEINGQSWTFGADIREEIDKLTGPAAALRDMILDIPEAFATMANAVAVPLNNLIGNLVATYNMIPLLSDIDPNTGQIPKMEVGDWAGWTPLPSNAPGADNRFSNDKYSGPADPTSTKPKTWVDPKTGITFVPGPNGGWIPADQARKPGAAGGPYDVPAPPPTDPKTGKKLSDKEILDNIAAGIDPSQYKVDPYAPIAGLPNGGGPMPGGGYSPSAQNAQDILEAQHSVESQAHDLEESKLQRLALEKSGNATQKEIDDAKWKELEDGWALQKAQANLAEKQRGTAKNLKDGMDSLGVALDPDLGLSQGLSGFAENMTRMLGNMLFAPLEKQLQATINADPLKGGFGLLGINAAKNMSNGLSPLFGQPYGDGTGSTGITAAGTPASSTYPGDAALLASVPRGIGHYDNATKDLSQGLVDCASGVEDLVNIMDGKSTAGGSLWTGNASSVLPSMGFQRGMGGPGDFRIGYNSGHMQATLPGGTPVNYGSTPAIQAGGLSGSQGADDPSFTDHWYRPAGATAAMPGAGGYGGMAGAGGAQPVFVVNMPGGGMGAGGFPPGSPASGQGSGPAPGPGGGSGFNWDAIAGAEASGNWANKSNPKYQGGLQFDPNTWAKVRPAGAPANAADATREQQIAGAEALLATGATPATQWPATFKAHPEWFSQGGVPGSVDDVHSAANMNPALNNPPPPLGNPADLFTGGGGQGPIFRKPQGGSASASGTGYGDLHEGTSYVPPGAEYGPSQFLGLDPTQPFGPLSQALGGGFSPMPSAPGSIGPFPVPGQVQAAAPGGIGNSANLSMGMGPGTAGWTPSAPGAPAATPTTYGGVQTGGTPAMGGTGGIGVSDGLMALASTAASGLDLLMPGAGQAAQTGMKLANRAIQYGSQLAGIGVSGLLETFLPSGGSELAGGGWIPRIVGGIAGAKPALPNVAGGKAGNGTNGDPGQGAPPLSPQQAQAHGGGGSPGQGNTNNVNIDYQVQNQTEDRSGKDLESHIMKGLGG